MLSARVPTETLHRDAAGVGDPLQCCAGLSLNNSHHVELQPPEQLAFLLFSSQSHLGNGVITRTGPGARNRDRG